MHIFIPTLAELSERCTKCLRMIQHFDGVRSNRKLSWKAKNVLSSSLTMISPVKGLSLTLYLTFTNKLIDALLTQEVEGVEHLCTV